MFKVHGVNMFPSQVEEVLGLVDFTATGEKIKQLFKSRLNVTPKVAVIALNTLPRSEKKTQRVFDHRAE